MLDKLPVLSPEETIPLLQHQFYYPPYITLAHMYKPPAGWFMTEQEIMQYQLLYGVDGMAENIIDGTTYEIKKEIFTLSHLMPFVHYSHPKVILMLV